MIHFLLIIILLFLIPIDCSFNQNLEENVKVFILIFLLADIFMNLNTGSYNKGFLVKKRKIILMNYLKNGLLPDLLTFVLYAMDTNDLGHYKFCKLLFFLRWRNLQTINFKLQEKFKIALKINQSFIELINLLFFSIYILNIFACLWFYIAFIYENDPKYQTWLSNPRFVNESLLNQYFYSLYWSAVTIMTATNITEVIFSIFTIIFGCGLFAYFINSIGIIIGEINKESHIFKYFNSLKKNFS